MTDVAAWRGGEWRPLLALAVPLALSQLAQIAIGTTDVVMMGWLGPEALAAGSLGSSVFFMLFLIGLGVLLVVPPLAAEAVGAEKPDLLRATIHQGLWVATAIGVPFAVVVWFTEPILLLLGQDAAVAAMAGDYQRVMLWGMVPGLWLVVLRGYVSALSRPRALTVVLLLGVGFNALSNYGLMFGNFGLPALGLVGAGISSSLVQTLMCLGLLAYLRIDRGFREHRLLAGLFRADWARFRLILKLGTPVGITLLCDTGVLSGAVMLIGLFGAGQLAGHAIAMQCAMVALMVPLGIAQATTVRVGLAVGRGDRIAVGDAGWSGTVIALIAAAAVAMLFWMVPDRLAGLFLDRAGPDAGPAFAMAVSFLWLAALFHILQAVVVVLAGAVRGMRDTTTALWFVIGGYWGVGFGCAAFLALPLGLEGKGVWIGLIVGYAVMTLGLIRRFRARGPILDKLVTSSAPAAP